MKLGTKKYIRKYILLLLMLAAVVLIVNSSIVLAKYTSQREHNSEISNTSEFHFTSDIAETDTPTYSWYSGIYENGVRIKVFNYDKNNLSLVSDVDISYTVTAADCVVTCYDSNGAEVSAEDDGTYTLPAVEGEDEGEYVENYHLLVIVPNKLLPEGDLEVSIESTFPFSKTLSCIFDVDTTNRDIVYTVTDKDDRGEYVEIVIYTNAYRGNIKIEWSEGVAPDPTDPLMRDWLNMSEGEIEVYPFSTYTFEFFNLDGGSYTESDIVITEVTE